MANDIVWHDVFSELTAVLESEDDFVTKADRALDIGAAALDVEHGHVTRILPDLDHWEVVASTDSPTGPYPRGVDADLRSTFCRRTIDHQGPLALHHASSQGWADDVAYLNHGLECYIGVPFEPGGQLSGTLCFVDDDTRSAPFTDDELAFVEWLGTTLETEFGTQEQALSLESYRLLTGILTRVLRHNIRNEVTVLQGYVDILVDQLDEIPADPSRVDAALDRVIALAEKARDLQELQETDYELSQHSVPQLIRETIAAIEAEHPAAAFSVTAPGDVQLFAYPSLDIAFRELLENAARHGGETPQCTVTVEQSADAVSITITDDGPGLSEHDRQVLEGRPETAVRHGSGIGLWIVWWAIDAHDGTIDVDSSGSGTSITVTVPRPELNRKLMHDDRVGAEVAAGTGTSG